MSVEENKKVATKYHELDPSNFDEILTPDFLGQHGENGFTWNLEQHRQNWTQNKGQDVIHEQFGEDNMICTRFTRTMMLQGIEISQDMLHIKTFRDGKIAHIWEYIDMQKVHEKISAKK